jgi:CDP-diacylglycerol--glycerol-3-phosphate 3-phosphatidyltransferase
MSINLANGITLSRLMAVPIMFVAIAHEWQMPALVVFGIACATDWLDGYVARKYNLTTDLGKALDPLVDKLVILAPLLALVELGQVPAWAVYVILARELLVTAWRGNSQQGANVWGKTKTVSQMVAIATLLLQWKYAIYSLYLAVALTLWSGLSYVLPERNAMGDRSS